MNLHSSDDCYYEEWFEDAEDGWRGHILSGNSSRKSSEKYNVDHYVDMGDCR